MRGGGGDERGRGGEGMKQAEIRPNHAPPLSTDTTDHPVWTGCVCCPLRIQIHKIRIDRFLLGSFKETVSRD